MQKFSNIFRLGKEQSELDFVDITPGKDTPLYLDPYALTMRQDEWSEQAHSYVASFFKAVLDSVTSQDKQKGIRLLSRLNEPDETHLGESLAGNTGRGVGEIQADDLYMAIAKSKAAKSGILEDLSDIALFIPRIGRDKISDTTTNIIRRLLVSYTQDQCSLHNIPMRSAASGFLWNIEREDWEQNYVDLPVHDDRKILLVPKHAVRYQVSVDHTNYRRMFVLEYLKAEHLKAGDSLVSVLTNKKTKKITKKVYKKTVDNHYPADKDFLATFSTEHPEVLNKYRDELKLSNSKVPNIGAAFSEEKSLAIAMSNHLSKIPKGSKDANRYHEECIGLLSFLFFPNLIYPKKEHQINQGRKRIDITYTNGKDSGLFHRLALDQRVTANIVHVECKNYTNKIDNPAIDQLGMRFDNIRGRFGLLVFRESDDLPKLITQCGDVAKQNNGIILPIEDLFFKRCLKHIADGNRNYIDREINDLYQAVIS